MLPTEELLKYEWFFVVCFYLFKQTIRLFVQLSWNCHRQGRVINLAIVALHLVEYHTPNSQRTDCHHQHFYRNVNDDLQWKRRQSRRVLHVSRIRHCITSRSIYCHRFTWSICVAMVIVYWFEKDRNRYNRIKSKSHFICHLIDVIRFLNKSFFFLILDYRDNVEVGRGGWFEY